MHRLHGCCLPGTDLPSAVYLWSPVLLRSCNGTTVAGSSNRVERVQGPSGCNKTSWRFDESGYLRAVLTARVYDVAVRFLPAW